MSQDKRISNRQKLQALLRELFQFDCADLDFGIYRIMNQKRQDVERFIEHDLLDAVAQGLAHFQAAEREDLETQLAEKRRLLGPTAFDETGAVREAFQGLPIAQEYMQAWHALKQLDLAAETEARIFNDLYAFFARYYDNGDFLTERRYSSRSSRFVVPYNGEEVLLHWANRDQYYVKTGEYFTDYRFTAGEHTVWFRLGRAEIEQDNVRGETRHFVLRDQAPLDYDAEAHTLTVHFEYRPLTAEEEARFLAAYNAQQPRSGARKTLDRAALCAALEVEILERLAAPTLRAYLAAVPQGQDDSLLRQHLNRYTARHTMDYFVHKDLGRFLRGELDFFLKNEVLHVNDVIGDASSAVLQHVLTRMRVVRHIAERIIAFLAQIENFQKRLFEKKKFVVQTDYCLTLDRVPEEFYPEILANAAQREAWQQLYRMEAWDRTLFWNGAVDAAFLKNHPYLMIDTAFFDAGFKARLLATFNDLDAAVDGVLIHGENFQALNLLQAKYAGQVKCIYIDPPYNTGNDDNFTYKDNYQHSSWLTMMEDRLRLAHRLLAGNGVMFVSIDDREKSKLRELMDIVYSQGMFIASFVRKRRAPSAMSQNMVSQDHEYVLAYGAPEFATFSGVEKDYSSYSNPDNDPRGDWVAGDLTVGMTKEQRPNQYYELVDPETGKVYSPDPNRVWAYIPETMQPKIEEKLIIFPEDPTQRPKLKRFKKDLKIATNPLSTWIDTETDNEQGETISLSAGLNTEGTRQIQSLFEENVFSYAKPTSLISTLVEQVVENKDIALDFFAGSGTTAHAVMDLNRQDGGRRKYVLVEIGDYFDTVLRPRIQKVAFSAHWKDGLPQDQDGTSHVFKYQRLESYEDALNNVHVRQPEGAQRRFLYETLDDYALGYMLDFETRDSPTLLTQQAFEQPFACTLRIQRGHASPQDTAVDLVETFHYLIGMHVQRLEQYTHQGRPYLVSRGEVRTATGVEKVVAVWRDAEGLNLNQEADWANAALLTGPVDRVYVNGPSFIKKAEPLEITFRDRM